MHVVIVTGGTFQMSPLIQKALDSADLIIAADSGANTITSLGIYPQIVVGDFDSLNPKIKKILQRKESKFISFSIVKDETDTELAIDYAIQHGATSITLLGGLQGDRFDHVIGNIFLLSQIKIPIVGLNSNQKIWIEKGPKKVIIDGNKYDLLSLIPLKSAVTNITTDGLYYSLKNENLEFGRPRGVSNVLTSKKAIVKFKKGLLLFIHTTTL